MLGKKKKKLPVKYKDNLLIFTADAYITVMSSLGVTPDCRASHVAALGYRGRQGPGASGTGLG